VKRGKEKKEGEKEGTKFCGKKRKRIFLFGRKRENSRHRTLARSLDRKRKGGKKRKKRRRRGKLPPTQKEEEGKGTDVPGVPERLNRN